jgi:peptidoglycan/LPS O-acetylase OafA/YrhL
MLSANNGSRIVFLDYLRAIACLLVAIGHLYLLGINDGQTVHAFVPSVVGNIFGSNSVYRNVLSGPSTFLIIRLGISVGQLGVAIFFLISGFVILRSVERESVKQFVIRRILRIYPVSIIAVTVAGVVTALYCASTGTQSPHSAHSIIVSAFVLSTFIHVLPTTPVLWSLSVELVFYVVMACLALNGRLGYRALTMCSLISVIFIALVYSGGTPNPFAVDLSFCTMCVNFLLIGSMIYRMTTVGPSFRGFAHVFVSIALYVVARHVYTIGRGSDTGAIDLANGAWALLIFCAALASGMKWNWLRPLKWFGDISYPLYLIHVPLGWIMMAWLASHGLGMLVTSIATGLSMIFCAWLLHVLVEEPARRLGRMLSSLEGRSAAPDTRRTM